MRGGEDQMGKWIGVGILVLLGVSLLGGRYTIIGLAMFAAAGVIIWMAVRGSNSSSEPAQPSQLSSARFDAREAITNAERDAKRLVREAQADAETQGTEALRSVMTFLSQEPRWV